MLIRGQLSEAINIQYKEGICGVRGEQLDYYHCSLDERGKPCCEECSFYTTDIEVVENWPID